MNFLCSAKNIYYQVTVFKQALMKVFWRFIRNKVITVDYRHPPTVNENIKNKINKKSLFASLSTKTEKGMNII